MENLVCLVQAILAFGLINVWIFRNNKSTGFRGDNAKTLKEEFKAYGLPESIYYSVGFLKLTSALLFIVGFWYPEVLIYPAAVIVVLMLGALAMHVKVKDPLKKSVPAFLMLLLSAFVLFNSL